jgi:hypothetical protein
MSGNTIAIIAVSIGVSVFIGWLLYRKYFPASSSSHLNDGINWRRIPAGYVPRSTKAKRVTELGQTIFADNESRITDQMLVEADEAYNERKEKAIRESQGTYTDFPPPTLIDIFVPTDPCVPSPVQRIPSFLMKAGRDYEASIYDQHYSKGPYDPPVERNGVLLYSEPDDCAVVYAAELLVSLSTVGSSIPPGFSERRDQWIVCPGQYWKEGCSNGWDHVIVAHCDGGYFAETNGPAHVHPIPFRIKPSGLIADVKFILEAPMPLRPAH